MCDCSDLVGVPYRRGADGTDGAIDCIHLVYAVLERLEIRTPAFRQEWYEAGWRDIARDLLKWGYRIPGPRYDGDVLLFPQSAQAFGVTWHAGILYINQMTKRVAWCPVSNVTPSHCFRSKES